MKSNTIYKETLELIESSRYILILTHINPDADTLSCALALSNYFSENKIKHKVFNKDTNIPRYVDFLQKYDKITNQLPEFSDLVIYVDCGDKKRPGIEISPEAKIINIDHHQSNDDFGDINIVDINKASTAEVLYQFFKQNDLTISKNTAECLYVGTYDDSLSFTTPRVDESTFETIHHLVKCGAKPNYIANNLTRRESLAKYRLLPKVLDSLELHLEGKVATVYVLPQWIEESGADYTEAEEAVNMALRISVVNIAIFLRIVNGKTRISLRSKNDIDVSKIAQHFNGGGHKMAAGCSYPTTDLMEAKNKILEYIKGYQL
jgi:phosphoesterase RecJ-like protein